MKSYYLPDRLQLVGKAWEIRYMTRKWLTQASPDVKLADFLKARSKCFPLPEPPCIPKEKNTDPRVLFFPSS